MPDDTPIYETLFDIQMSLCKIFPALTPLTLRREKAREVFLLINRYNKHSLKNNNGNKTNTTQNGVRVIRRKAGDNWF